MVTNRGFDILSSFSFTLFDRSKTKIPPLLLQSEQVSGGTIGDLLIPKRPEQLYASVQNCTDVQAGLLALIAAIQQRSFTVARPRGILTRFPILLKNEAPERLSKTTP
jgi:hypothetical protein